MKRPTCTPESRCGSCVGAASLTTGEVNHEDYVPAGWRTLGVLIPLLALAAVVLGSAGFAFWTAR